jgi:hypothetical protein
MSFNKLDAYVRIETLRAVSLKMTAFWDIPLHHPDDGGSTHL